MESMEPNSPQPASWFDRIPKVELHLHLEGAIPPATLWSLIQKYGGDPSVPTIESLRERFRYRDFAHFIDTWVWKNGFLREYEDFERIASEVAADLARQGIRYVEAFYSPGDYRARGLEPGRLTAAIRRGLDRCPEIEVALVADLIRDHGPERAARMLDAVHEAREHGVIGVGIGGSEEAYPAQRFAPVFRRAREIGFRTSAHAGEAAGPESVWDVIRSLEVDRIGHATRAIEDPDLLDHLAARHIPIEVCISSNLRTGAVRSVAEHPVRTYFERGIPISINTDDPRMFETSLAAEYKLLVDALGFRRADIEALVLQAAASSWLPPACKDALGQRLARELAAARRAGKRTLQERP
ncbi:MAG: adenosine deaminase [Candidatus Eisenbacteria bacterium]|nr:adenosine deaminase [Candidatus Eisenbacteria bacterium]